MAKELPYFKFTVAEWLTGDIVYENFSVQGLFINICAIYWQREGELSIDDINKRFKNPPELKELSGRFFSLDGGLISIAFLDEQFQERKRLSSSNSANGKKGVLAKAAKKQGIQATPKRPLSEGQAKSSNIEKRREEKNNSKKDVAAPLSIYELCVEFWLKEFKPGWTFSGQQGKAMKSIINKIEKLADGDTTKTLQAFKRMCNNLPEWYQNKDLPVIDSKFNEIITEIKAKKPIASPTVTSMPKPFAKEA